MLRAALHLCGIRICICRRHHRCSGTSTVGYVGVRINCYTWIYIPCCYFRSGAMFLGSIYIVSLQTLAASIYADGDSYHRCRACMCGRDYYAHIHVAMEYADYLSNMFLSSEWLGHYPSYLEDCRDYCDDNYGAWNCFVLVPMVHFTGMSL